MSYIQGFDTIIKWNIWDRRPPLWAGPDDVLIWIFDLAGLAVQAI
jgi:hypothetical protein